MARIVSFVILVVILVILGVLFYQVIESFILPLFLAVLLVVMFGPLHRWILRHARGHDRLAAMATTVVIVLILLVPLSLIVLQATLEAVNVYNRFQSATVDLHDIAERIARFGDQFGLALSAAQVEAGITDEVKKWLAPLVLGTTEYLGGTVVGIAIMIVALYYFLADGRGMIRTVMRLSPLEDRYEEQLVEQFDSLARSVVLAMLISAAAQAFLAAGGYYLAGFRVVFLLMMLTFLFAMIPFIGAAGIWIPASLWLWVVDGRPTAAIVLAIYGAVVVSMADNVIKPMVLRGRANLHPLLALLSVLGGLQALGPIGLFVGPMVVVFLQTLLRMVNAELVTFAQSRAAGKVEEAIAGSGEES